MRITDAAAGPNAIGTRVLILTADKFEDLELLVPYFRLLEAGATVTVAAPTLDDIGGEHGYRITPDAVIGDLDPSDYDLLVIPGGFPDGAPATVRDNPHAQDIARAFMTQDKPVASICHGPWLLASADVVRGRRLTSYWEDDVPTDIRAAGGEWENTPVVIDRNLVTARWPPDLPAFCAAMMDMVNQNPG
jgi:protease I